MQVGKKKKYTYWNSKPKLSENTPYMPCFTVTQNHTHLAELHTHLTNRQLRIICNFSLWVITASLSWSKQTMAENKNKIHNVFYSNSNRFEFQQEQITIVVTTINW